MAVVFFILADGGALYILGRHLGFHIFFHIGLLGGRTLFYSWAVFGLDTIAWTKGYSNGLVHDTNYQCAMHVYSSVHHIAPP